jgi:NACHT domain
VGKQPLWRRWLSAIRRLIGANLALALAWFLLPWAWLGVQLLLNQHPNNGAVGLAATISLGVPALWLAVAGYLETRRPAKVSELTVAQVADQLAVSVGNQWNSEAAILNDPYPLPVSWTAADPSLTDPWDSVVRQATRGAGRPAPQGTWATRARDLAGKGDELAEVLAKVPTGRLVVLGEPGTGKTMLMVRLVLDLLARRGEAGSGPVPILVSAASWNPAKQDLRSWLASQLITDHPALANPPPANRDEPTLAAALLAEERLILPILDGLDEIPERDRGPAISKINEALRPGQQFVVTSRGTEYRDAVRPKRGAEVTLRGAAAVQLRPLRADAIRRYLPDAAAGPVARARWEPVLKLIGTRTPVGQALSTPLMISLARATYNPRPGEPLTTSRDPAELRAPAVPNRQAVESLLFDAFIPSAYRPGTAGRRTAMQAEMWLAFLARHLEQSIESPNLAWWQLQEHMPRHAFELAARLMGWVLFFLVFGVVFASIPTGIGALVGLLLGCVPLFGLDIVFRLAGKPGSAKAPARRLRISVTGLVVGVGIGIVVGGQFGPAVGLAVGFAGAFGGGLTGVPSHLAEVTSPRAMLARDRQIMLLIILAGGLVGGLVFGLAFGLAAGIAGLVFGLVVGLARSMSQTAWPSYTLTRVWLAFHNDLPWRLMSFLSDAHERGVLRQTGVVYQFRHIELQHRLADRPALAKRGAILDIQDGRGAKYGLRLAKYGVRLAKVIDPFEATDLVTETDPSSRPESGNRRVAAVFEIKARNGNPINDEIGAAIFDSNGQIYHPEVYSFGGHTNSSTGTIHAAQGEIVTGWATFQIPDGINVARVQWIPGGLSPAVQWRVRR